MKILSIITVVLLIIGIIFMSLKIIAPKWCSRHIWCEITAYICFLLAVLFLSINNLEFYKKQPMMKNIYGEPLKKCQKYSTDYNGSWDKNGYCSEKDGGVHQICFAVDESTVDFANDTHQGENWTETRLNKNHCMCIGAWALYKAKQEEGSIPVTNDELQCDAIPKVSLTDAYLNTWATWNGNELPGQIVHGVNKLVEQCYEKAENESQRTHLRDLYLDLTNNHHEFADRTLSFNQR